MAPICLLYATRRTPITMRNLATAIKWPLLSAISGGLLAWFLAASFRPWANSILTLLVAALAVGISTLLGLWWSGDWRTVRACLLEFRRTRVGGRTSDDVISALASNSGAVERGPAQDSDAVGALTR